MTAGDPSTIVLAFTSTNVPGRFGARWPPRPARAEASRRVRDAIVAATVRIVAREGVAAVTHRRVAAEAGRLAVLDDLALRHQGRHPRGRAALDRAATRSSASAAIADRLGDADFDPSAWAEELADWLIEQVTAEREIAVALYRLQVELLGSAGALEVHREWGEGLRAVGERVLERSPTRRPSSTSGSSSPRSTGCASACSACVRATPPRGPTGSRPRSRGCCAPSCPSESAGAPVPKALPRRRPVAGMSCWPLSVRRQ